MTDDEARKLATRIIDTWPTGPRAYIWRDAIIECDAHIAAVTYRMLRDSIDQLTVKRFREEYDRQRLRLRPPPAADELPDHQPDAELISLNEYLRRLEQRAQHNPEAAEEFKRWTRRNHPTTRERT